MKMKSLNLKLRLPERDSVSFHRNGDCRCGRRHLSIRYYSGYSCCLRCGKLQPMRMRSKKVVALNEEGTD